MPSYIFPDIGEPNISSAANTGDSYKVKSQDSTISTTSDANYKKTRPRTTRMVRKWTFAWNCRTDEQYNALMDFWNQVGTFQYFDWVCPIDNETYQVRFAEPFEWQHNYPYGWQGSLKFEEV